MNHATTGSAALSIGLIAGLALGYLTFAPMKPSPEPPDELDLVRWELSEANEEIINQRTEIRILETQLGAKQALQSSEDADTIELLEWQLAEAEEKIEHQASLMKIMELQVEAAKLLARSD